MAGDEAAEPAAQSFLWWLVSPLLGLGIFLIPMAIIGESGATGNEFGVSVFAELLE